MINLKTLGTYVYFLLISQLLFGCSLKNEPLPRAVNVIIIKNSTPFSLQEVSVSENFSLARRMGSISPVLSNSQQVFERPTHRPRLPKFIEVRWNDYNNHKYQKKLHLEPLLIEASQGKNKTLIIDFLKGNRVKAYLIK